MPKQELFQEEELKPIEYKAELDNDKERVKENCLYIKIADIFSCLEEHQGFIRQEMADETAGQLEFIRKNIKKLADLIRDPEIFITPDSHLAHMLGNFEGSLPIIERLKSKEKKVSERLLKSFKEKVFSFKEYLHKLLSEDDFFKGELEESRRHLH